MSDEETVHHNSKITLRPRKKSINGLICGNTSVRAAKEHGVPALERETHITYTEGLEEKAVFPVGIKVEVIHQMQICRTDKLGM